jgi:hypothetical protein
VTFAAPALAATILLSVTPALAADGPRTKADQCFRSESYQGFAPINDHAFNIRVAVNDFYRIELQGACPTLTRDATLITHVRGSDLICGPLDWDLQVRESGGGVAIGCIVKSQHKLTAAEVAAIPPKEKP